jgi:phenylalanine-4-hydroxylase
MTQATRMRIPPHLLKYIVEQNYARYTSEDQAVWRYIMRQLKHFLGSHAHASYLDGLKKSAIDVERIPRIGDIDEHLEKFGWGAVPVSGFIPPAAFMEFQAIGVLPIAADMRTINHLLYTPAPDIVHEAAGHAPILADPDYANYLRQYGEVARHSIISKEDMAQYEAIRVLSDAKENPASTADDVARAEAALTHINESMKNTSEAALLSRMNWWTSEYGLIGRLNDPKIFGAGLLSSVGEATACLNPKVKKLPLTVDCVDYAYDITEPQPQLFVTEDFAHLGAVLEDLAERLSYRRGGVFGLETAVEAETVNTVQFNSGIQISGTLTKFLTAPGNTALPIYLQFSGPCQLSYNYQELTGQGATHHAQGFSTPIGFLKNHRRCLSTYTSADLSNMAITRGVRSRMVFESGVHVEGMPSEFLFIDEKLILITWQDCRVTFNESLLFDPAWGTFDMAVGAQVASVFGGPADRSRYGQTEDFVAARVPAKAPTAAQEARHQFFQKIRDLRENSPANAQAEWHNLSARLKSETTPDWLHALELLEIANALNLSGSERAPLLAMLDPKRFATEGERQCVKDGVALAAVKL